MTDVKSEDTGNLNPNDETEDVVFDYDKILQEEVGQFGWFQVRNIILALVVVIFLASNNSYVFTTARIPTRCLIPECDVPESEFIPDWLLSAVPGTSLDSFDNCLRYANASITLGDGDGVCPAIIFDKDHLENCGQYLYENTDTIVYDFELACHEWRRSMVGSIRISGNIFAQMITGFVSDRWGRRTAIVFNVFNAGWIGLLRSFSPNYIIFVTAEFLSSVLGSAGFQSCYILVMELVRPDKRVFVGACMNTFSSLGLVFLGLTAWAVPYWRNLTRVLYVPQLFVITYLCIMSESVRWYKSKDRYEDIEKSLKNIASVNKKHVSEATLEILKKKAKDRSKRQQISQENDQATNEPSLLNLLFQYKPVLVRSLITPFLWISFTLIYQGILINAVDISGNKYVNYIAVSCAQIPGFWISLLLLDKIGRKPVLIAAYWLCAVCQITFIFVPNGQRVLSLAVYMVGATCSGAIFSTLYIYTAELYPTQFRHRLFGFSSTVGRVGAVLAPLTPALSALVWDQFPFALFAGCACVAGALVLLTPETRGLRLPDTMQEAADLGRKKHSTDI